MDQTAFLAQFLLARMRQVETLLVVLAPRDFEACTDSDTAFFDPRMVGAYLSGLAPSWLVHFTAFRPLWLLREAIRQYRMRDIRAVRYAEDGHGTSVLRQTHSYFPEPVLDRRCDAAITRMEAAAAAHDVRLVVVTLPVMPAWAASFDPDGFVVEEWTRRISGALRRNESLLIDGRGLAWSNDRFADPVHLLYPYHTEFSEFIAENLSASTSRLRGTNTLGSR
ncbi:hypothetical protein [Falsiroseomonas sp. E2-1-a20]|uniref:hypothetical protein n=1 Tax=Falsiroseomonas sp. E2-1-a20 TaxID=3239300 RepID=UPI003F3D75C5